MQALLKLFKRKSLDVLGLMSGTSADGLDIAMCRISGDRSSIKIKLLAAETDKYSKKTASLIKELAASKEIEKDSLFSTENQLADFYVKKIRSFLKSHKFKMPGLIGSHGQTIHHADPRHNRYGGSWQIVDGARLSANLGVAVVFDFRTDDIALGGSGAPLMPICHHYMFSRKKESIAVLNIGGISNLTYLPANNKIDNISASDCGPGNMIVDDLMQKLFKRGYDKNGAVAIRGKVSNPLLKYAIGRTWYKKPYPKSLGREQFGREFVESFLKKAIQLRLSDQDIIATASEITIKAVVKYHREHKCPANLLVCGGGARNRYFMKRLAEEFSDCRVTTTADEGIDPDYVEAAGFALLAYLNIRGIPANLPDVTGAQRKTVLGKIALP